MRACVYKHTTNINTPKARTNAVYEHALTTCTWHALQVGKRGLFSCVFADVNDGSKNKTSSTTGVVAETGVGALVHYRIPCAVPNWPAAWTQKTKVAVYFKGTSLVAYVVD